MEITQQQMVMAMAVQSTCLSMLERTRHLVLQSQSQPETVLLLQRAALLAKGQLTALQTALIALSQAMPNDLTQAHSLRLFGLTQQAHSMASQFNLDRKTLALGPRSAPQISSDQIALRIERSLDTWESEVIGQILLLAQKLEE